MDIHNGGQLALLQEPTVCSKSASDISTKNRFEVHEMRSRGFRTAKICCSVSGKYDFSPLVTLDFELVL